MHAVHLAHSDDWETENRYTLILSQPATNQPIGYPPTRAIKGYRRLERWLGPTPWARITSAYVAGRWRGYFDFHARNSRMGGSYHSTYASGRAKWIQTTPVRFEPQGSHRRRPTTRTGSNWVMRDFRWLGMGTCKRSLRRRDGWDRNG